MSPDALLGWVDSNGLVVGLLGSLVSFWAGFRSNLWMARRNEWNAVADRVRASLLKAQHYGNFSIDIGFADTDLLINQSSWLLRKRIQRILRCHSTLHSQYEHDPWNSRTYTPEQILAMEKLRDQLLTCVKRR